MAERPNILVIMSGETPRHFPTHALFLPTSVTPLTPCAAGVGTTDQHSKAHLGCMGDGLVRTPHLDKLARDGVLCTNAYTPAPVCVPARMSFMTTRTPSGNECWLNRHILDSAIPTWAHALAPAGYETALIGRMHFVGTDHRHGFESRPIGEPSASPPGVSRVAAQFKDIPGATSGQSRESIEIAGYGTTTYTAYDEAVAAKACEWLRERAAGDDDRPFAAVTGFVLPHCPFFAPKELFDYYFERVSVPAEECPPDEPQSAAVRRWRANRGMSVPLTPHQIRVARAAYLGLCEHLDAQIGTIMDTLEATGLAESTLVIYTSVRCKPFPLVPLRPNSP